MDEVDEVDEADAPERAIRVIREEIGVALRAGRRRTKQSQRAASASAGLSRSCWARLEAGTGNPTLQDVVTALASVGVGLRLPCPDADPVPPGAHDRAGRRLPAHLEIGGLDEPRSWWPGWTDIRLWGQEPMWTFWHRHGPKATAADRAMDQAADRMTDRVAPAEGAGEGEGGRDA